MERAKIVLTKRTQKLAKIIKRAVGMITMFIIKDAVMIIQSMFIMQDVVMSITMSTIIITTVVGTIMGTIIMTIHTITLKKNLENDSLINIFP